jgi:hypothetical protein
MERDGRNIAKKYGGLSFLVFIDWLNGMVGRWQVNS